MKLPKVLIYDIETAPIIAYVWGLWDNNVALNQIKSDWHLLSWSAKWVDDPSSKVMYMDQRNEVNIEDDRRILKGIWKLLNEADIVITQNGKKFDEKKLNARFILNGFKPPSGSQHIDTLQLAKKSFGFSSNKLEYLSKALNKKYKKHEHKKFPGFDLWKECLKGNLKAWEEMEKYNKYDVLALEEVYRKLQPWGTGVNPNTYLREGELVCSCGSTKFKKDGFRFMNAGKYQRYACTQCGCTYRAGQNLLTVQKRKTMYKI